MADRTPDVMLADIKMPGMDGLELLGRTKEAIPSVVVIMMTAYATVDYAVQALKEGAYDFIKKPFDPDDLARLVEKALQHRGLVAENIQLKRSIEEISRFDDIVGESAPMRELLELVDNVAGHGLDGADSGRVGDGEGTDCPRGARGQLPAVHAHRPGFLRGDSGHARGVGTLRPREGRVHRRPVSTEGEARAGGRRNALSG